MSRNMSALLGQMIYERLAGIVLDSTGATVTDNAGVTVYVDEYLSTATLFDYVPELPDGMPEDSFPYVVIGERDFSPFRTDDTPGADVDVTFHTWSRYKGRKEVTEIQDELFRALDRDRMGIRGIHVLDCQRDFSTVLMDPIGAHGVDRYRLKIQAAN